MSILSELLNPKRIHTYIEGKIAKGPIVYWMQRDQRSNDNWALLFAQELSLKTKNNLVVVFCLANKFLDATFRQYDFMLKGLFETKDKLNEKNISLNILIGSASNSLPSYLKRINASCLITDFNPLKIALNWKEKIKESINIPFYEVDAHNIVPCRYASNKQEIAAYTFRPKINKLLSEFLTDFPALQTMPDDNIKFQEEIKYDELIKTLEINFEVKPSEYFQPGEKAAFETLKKFLHDKIHRYNQFRNDPNADAVSNLSPYLHFGHISPQRVAFEIATKFNDENSKSFLEELIVRRELADNFCYYNKNYDSFEGFPDWAKKELIERKNDKRDYVYNLETLEKAQTHDDLWNSAQLEMVKTGKMHGYMRMYWAKKILEWTENCETALSYAIYLNDKYELDGRDPNGYVGIAWSIGGLHDRPFFPNKIFGKIRYMSLAGCQRKFDVDKYIAKNLNFKT